MVAEAESAIDPEPGDPGPVPSTWLARRRIGLISTPRPITTLIAGILAPPVLFAMSQRLEAGLSNSVLVPFKPYSTLLMAASVAILLLWLATGRRQGWGHALLAGPLFLAGFAALAIGLFLLPFSIIGILVGGIGFLGFLGFIPFWTSVAYFRAAFLAHESARRQLEAGPRLALAALAACAVGTIVVVSGSVAKHIAEREIRIVLGEQDGDSKRAEQVLFVLYVFPQVSLQALWIWALDDQDESMQPGPIALAFERITGRPAVHND